MIWHDAQKPSRGTFGGIPTPRTLVMAHLKRVGVTEPSPAYFRWMNGAVADIGEYDTARLESLWNELREV